MAQQAAYQREWYQRNKARRREYFLQRNYGISSITYAKMLEEQNGLCAICQGECVRQTLSVDHNHDTGKVRGLLCDRCNRGLGYFKDDPQLIEAAINYLKEHS